MNDRGEVVGGAATPDDEAFEGVSLESRHSHRPRNGRWLRQRPEHQLEEPDRRQFLPVHGGGHAARGALGARRRGHGPEHGHSARLGPDPDERVVDQRRRADHGAGPARQWRGACVPADTASRTRPGRQRSRGRGLRGLRRDCRRKARADPERKAALRGLAHRHNAFGRRPSK